MNLVADDETATCAKLLITQRFSQARELADLLGRLGSNADAIRTLMPHLCEWDQQLLVNAHAIAGEIIKSALGNYLQSDPRLALQAVKPVTP